MCDAISLHEGVVNGVGLKNLVIGKVSVRVANPRLDDTHSFPSTLTNTLMSGPPECEQKITRLFPSVNLSDCICVESVVRVITLVKLEQL